MVSSIKSKTRRPPVPTTNSGGRKNSRSMRSPGISVPQLRFIHKELDYYINSYETHTFFEQRAYIAAINLHFEEHRIPVFAKQPVRMDFLLSAGSPSWLPLFRQCASDISFLCRVILLQPPQATDESTGASLLDPAFSKVPIIKYDEYDPYSFPPHLLVYQEADDKTYRHFPKVACHFIKKHGIRPVHIASELSVPACSVLLPGNRLNPHVQASYCQGVHSFAWLIATHSREIKESFRRCCLAGGEHVTVVPDISKGDMLKERILFFLTREE